DGRHLVCVRGGDHGSNWAAPGGGDPNPTSGTPRTRVEIWTVPWTGGGGRMLTAGDEPALSPKGDRVAYLKDGQVWSVPLAPNGKAEALFFARGRSGNLAWSPDGSALAFISNRGGHKLLPGCHPARTPAPV